MRYEHYYELSEKNGWRTTDLDWDALRREDAAGLVSPFDRAALKGTAVIEHGVPHYSEVWSLVEGLRDHWELWQFATLWTGEEARHSYALKKACDLLGLTPEIEADLRKVTEFRFAETQKQSCATDCYRTVPGMLAYTVIQELATHRFYTLAAKQSASPFLKDLFTRIGADEMRHHVFYREAMKEGHRAAPEAEREAWSEQVYRAVRAFKMPHLIWDLQVPFFEHGDWSIGTLGKMAFKAQLVRALGFDARLLARLVRDGAERELEAGGTRTPIALAAGQG